MDSALTQPVQWTQEAYNNLSSNAIEENNSVSSDDDDRRIAYGTRTHNTSNMNVYGNFAHFEVNAWLNGSDGGGT